MNRLFLSCLLAVCTLQAMAEKGVQVVPDEAHQRVDITIDGKPFTSYVWPTVLKKPVLYSRISSSATPRRAGRSPSSRGSLVQLR
jgi:hypothetical protein